MSTPYLSEITIFAGNFAPRNWAFCNGQIIPLQQNTALFSLLGTNYGGNGTTNFALPDFRGRAAVFWGTGPGLSNYSIGQASGTESVTLNTTQLPAHTHQMFGGTTTSTTQVTGIPSSTGVLTNAAQGQCYINTATSLIAMAPQAIGLAGGGQAHENRQPTLALTFIIATQGVFPARN